MIKEEEKIVMRAIALCFKPYLKQEEALIYCNLGRTQFPLRSEAAGVFKNENGYYNREDLDKMCAGDRSHGNSHIKLFHLGEKLKRK